MKYCSKCGNELLDEAVICPKCGCAAGGQELGADKLIQERRSSKLKAAGMLNLVAFILSIVLCVVNVLIFTTMEVGSDDPIEFFGEWLDEEGRTAQDFDNFSSDMDEWSADIRRQKEIQRTGEIGAYLYGALSLVIFLLGFKAKRSAQAKPSKLWAGLYLFFAIVTPIIGMVMMPSVIAYMLCGVGFIFFVPPILQLMAGVKYLQGTP